MKKGMHLNPYQLYLRLGGNDAAMAGVAKYVKKCTQFGGHWCRARDMADVSEVFWVEAGID
eukprot:8828497-Lingulodinium_polyedra.AAC.1